LKLCSALSTLPKTSLMYSINQAQDLHLQIATEAVNREDNLSDKAVATDYIIANLLKEMADTAKGLSDEIAVEKYKVAFIGTIGSGKTTTICHLLDLYFEKDSEKIINKKIRQVKEMLTVLTASGGGSTSCEVELRHGENTTIEIEPYSIVETERILKSFAENIISKAGISDEPDVDNDKARENLPFELERAIRNFISLQIGSSGIIEDEAIFQLSGSTEPEKTKRDKDQAIILYRKFQDDNKSDADFVQEIIKLAKLDERNISSLSPKPDDNKTLWLYDTFKVLNVGLYPNMVLPKRVIITISFAPLLSNFKSFIDTKGLDNGSPRQNISDLMEDIGTLCVFTSEFNSSPEANISEFLKRATAFNSKKHFERHMLLVLPRKNQAEKTLNSNGELINDFDEGIKIKANKILGDFNQGGIKLFEDQIYFYNPLRHFDDDNFPKANYQEDIIEEKNAVFAVIEKVAINKKRLISERLDQLEQDFTLINNGVLSEEDTQRLARLKDQLRDHKNLRFRDEYFKDKLIRVYRDSPNTRHHRTKHSLNGNDWVHPYNSNIQVILNLKQLYAQKTIVEFTQKNKIEIKSVINQLPLPDGSALFKQVSNQLFEIFESRYTNFVINTLQKFDGIIQKNLNDAFFQSLVDEYGQGPGYTDRVCDLMAGWIDKNKIRQEFEDTVNNSWLTTIDSFIKILQ